MARKTPLLLLIATLIAVAFGPMTVSAQDPHLWTSVQTNLRTGPGTNYDLIATLPVDVALIIEGRNRDTSWVLIRTTDGAVRGWGKTRLFRLAAGLKLYDFPISEEILNAPAAPVNVGGDGGGASGGDGGSGPAPSGTAPLNAPNVPKISGAIRASMRAVMAKGKELGNNFRVFSKVGDCQTDHHSFLKPIGWGQYDLGEYGYLQGVIGYFMVQPRPDVNNPFDVQSIASHNGFNSSAVQQPEFAPPNLCEAGEKPLICEYRLNKPGVAIIMFGTADVLVMSPAQFDKFMRNIVKDTMDRGIIPILSTFPENPAVATQSRQLNQLVVALGAQKGIPVMNLADALKPLPNWGLDPDGIHLTNPPGDNAGVFNAETLQYGFTVRNLLVLQTLDAVWRGILN